MENTDKIEEQNLIPAPDEIFSKEWAKLEGTYEYVEVAGSGKTAIAYHIRDKKNLISFCLKTVLPAITGKTEVERVRNTLRKEVEILSPLEHNCLPRIYTSDFEAVRPYYICSFHPGKTIRKYLDSGAKLERDESAYVVSALINVLEYLHSNGRTHNDVHLGNVMIGQPVFQKGIMLIDFGSGHRESDTSPNTEARGNIHFMPNRLKSMRERLVNRQDVASEFKLSDFSALGHLLAAVQDSFFTELTEAQNAALNAFCTRLTSGEHTTWALVKARFDSVLNPLQHFEAVHNSFINENGLREAIPIPIYGRVPIGPIWQKAINTIQFQSLRGIKQLAFCDWFFPGAQHSRFEHSLGVFNLMRSVLDHLSVYSEVRDLYDESDLKGALFAALMHDVGHYPFAHLMEQYVASRYPEDAEILSIVSHSKHSLSIIESKGFCDAIFPKKDAARIRDAAVATLNGNAGLISDLLDGPVDIDKMDYLRRDSLHCGVRYGDGLDSERLFSYIRLTPQGGLSVAPSGVNAFEGFLILQNQMLGEVYWHEYTRAIISMFHVAIAHIVRTDRLAIIKLISELKACNSEAEAFKSILLPKLSKAAKAAKKENLSNLLTLHVKPDFHSIYRCIKKYSRADNPGRRQRISVYATLVKAGSNLSGSRLPVDWKNARLLRKAFLNAINELGLKSKAEDHDIIVDVPTGKTGQRVVDVLLEGDNVVPITKLSHIQASLFNEPAIFVSPVRVFVSPRIFRQISQSIERVILAAEEQFYSAESPRAEHEDEVGL